MLPRHLNRILLVLLLAACCGACGKKGPLYIPPAHPGAAPAVPGADARAQP